MIGKEPNRTGETWGKGLSGRQLRRILLICAVALFGLSVSGHQDPVGDVNPYVIVQNGRFVVSWKDNEPTLLEKPTRYYRQSYTVNGRPAAARETMLTELPVQHQEYVYNNTYLFRELMYEQRTHGQTFVFRFSPTQGNGQDKAAFQVVEVLGYERSREILENGGELWRRALIPEKTIARDLPNFPGGNWTTPRGAVVTRDRVVLLCHERPTEKQLKLPKRGIRHWNTQWQKLWVYERPGFGKPKVHSIGLCNSALFPFGQNLLAVQGHQALFVWLEPIPYCIYWETPAQHALWAKEYGYPKERPKAKLYLSSLNLKTGKMESRVLADDVHWNTSVALAVSGDRFLVAYHFGSEFHRPRDPDPKTPRSVIKLIFGDVPKAP